MPRNENGTLIMLIVDEAIYRDYRTMPCSHFRMLMNYSVIKKRKVRSPSAQVHLAKKKRETQYIRENVNEKDGNVHFAL